MRLACGLEMEEQNISLKFKNLLNRSSLTISIDSQPLDLIFFLPSALSKCLLEDHLLN